MKNVITTKLNPVVLLKRLLIFSVPFLLLINISYVIIHDSQYNSLIKEYEAKQHEALVIVSYVFGTIVTESYNDLLLVKNSDEFTRYIDDPDEQNLYEMEQMLSRIVSSKPNFDQLRFIDEDGMEVARIDNREDQTVIIPKDKLQDKSKRYYTIHALEMEEGTMYISNIDLNVENNVIVVPHELVIRFAVPIYQDDEIRGILIINYDGYNILSILDEYSHASTDLISVGIYDSKSYWSYSKDSETDSYTLTTKSIEDILPQGFLNNEIDENGNSFQSEDSLYHVHHLIDVDNIKTKYESEYYKIGVISSFRYDDVIAFSNNIILQTPSIPYIISAIVLIVIFIILLLIYQSKSENLVLTASQYISEYTRDGIIITDGKKRVIYCNHVFEDLFGYSLYDIRNMHINSFLHGNIKVTLSENEDGSSWQGNIIEMPSEGIYIMKFLKVWLIYDKKNSMRYYIGIYSEPRIDKKIAESPKWKKEPMSQADINLFYDISKIFNENPLQSANCVVLTMKIADFSDVKYNLDENESNSFTLTLCRRLKDALGENSIVLSPGTEFFFIRTYFIGAISNHANLITKIDSLLSKIVFTGFPNLRLSYFSGAAMAPAQSETGSELLGEAYTALEAAQKIKNSNHIVYDERIYDFVEKDKSIRHELKYAFQREEFSVVYQVQKTVEGRNSGVEALVRWTNERLGIVAPSLFVPIMEESEYINKLGIFVLKTVLNDFKKIKEKIPKDFKISIKLSSYEFTNKEVIESLVDELSSSGLKLENFCFEITESTLVNNLEHTNKIIKYLHTQNIIVAIDDFGTGFSSLGYLKTLYADKLKIDRTFIKDYPERDDGTLLKAIISMAQQLKIGVIVEGIENQDQLDLIKSVDCREYQGYYGSKPILFDEFVQRFLT